MDWLPCGACERYMPYDPDTNSYTCPGCGRVVAQEDLMRGGGGGGA